MAGSNSAFISYRRDLGFPWARLVWSDLVEAGIDAFLDLESVHGAGSFDRKLLNQIEGRPYFLVVLTPGSLRRCGEPGDWLWRELEHALATERLIVPLLVAGFDFAEADASLPADAAARLRSSNGITIVPEFFSDAVRKLREDRLRPVELPVRTLSTVDHEFAAAAHRRAQALPPPRVVDLVAADTGPLAPPRGRVDGDPDAPHPSAGGGSSPWSTRWVRVGLVALGAMAVLVPGAIYVAGAGDDGRSASSASPTTVTTVTVGTTAPVTAPPASTTASATVSTTVAAPTPTTTPGVLSQDELLEGGDSIESVDGRHVLQMTLDGRLEAWTGDRLWWHAPENREPVPGSTAYMQDDGNFVIYAGEPGVGDAVWKTGTGEHHGAELVIASDEAGRGYVEVVMDGDCLWRAPEDCAGASTGSNGSPVTTPAGTAAAPPTTACTTAVPSVNGETEERAVELVREASLTVAGRVVEELAPGDPRDGLVLDQLPEAGTSASCSDGVVLTIGLATRSETPPPTVAPTTTAPA